MVIAAMHKGSYVMRKTNCVVQVTIGALLSLPGLADEAKSFNTRHDALFLASSSAEVRPAGLQWVSGAQPSQPSKAIGYTRAGLRPISDFEFQDTDVFTRVTRIRSLALVTVAETRQARWFLGVNNRGVLGLHFSALPRPGASRNLEVLRMPYLEKRKPGN